MRSRSLDELLEVPLGVGRWGDQSMVLNIEFYCVGENRAGLRRRHFHSAVEAAPFGVSRAQTRFGSWASHSRYLWNGRLHLLCTLGGLPVEFALTGAIGRQSRPGTW